MMTQKTDYNDISVEDKLDVLTLQSLEIIEELQLKRKKLEQLMREGFLNMTRARYSMGSKAISSLQLPTEDDVIKATVTVERKSSAVIEFALSRDAALNKKLKNVDSSESQDKEGETIVRHRNVAKDDNLELSQSSVIATDPKKDSDSEIYRSNVKNLDPLCWFGILVPQNLRMCQQQFMSSAEIACHVASLQCRLRAIEDEMNHLSHVDLD